MIEYILFFETIAIIISFFTFAVNGYEFDVFTYDWLKDHTNLNSLGVILTLLCYIIFAHWIYVAMFVYWICHMKIGK